MSWVDACAAGPAIRTKCFSARGADVARVRVKAAALGRREEKRFGSAILRCAGSGWGRFSARKTLRMSA